ncbi:MAG: helix-turn-helix transcriptional regulator [Roseiarcus sp.]|jgi:DNA-binding CsgD family transcriptional regulator|uniref:helix-turn-helix transcriptional regulator n=1 Tax=Roseiarcus sp. TaxID=1969460 RepID=UPI003C6B9ECC
MEQREPNDFPPPSEREDAHWPSLPFAPQFASLKSAVEASAKAIEIRRRGARSEIADLQRCAIASLEECAIATFRLTNALIDTSSCDRASFKQQTSRFLDCAQQFALALASCAEPDGSVFREGGRSAPTTPDSFWERLASLTPKQRGALDLLLTGRPNKLIAHELGVAEATVKAHVGAIIRKLQVRNRAQVIAAAARLARFEGVGFAIDSVRESARNPPQRNSQEA